VFFWLIVDHAGEVIKMFAVVSEVNQVQRCEYMADLFEDAFKRKVCEDATVRHAQLGDGPLRRFEVTLQGLAVCAMEFGAMDSAAATTTGWTTAFLAKLNTMYGLAAVPATAPQAHQSLLGLGVFPGKGIVQA
jgi:hypothetical protein